MTDPAKPVRTATLQTPAMQSPHESLRLNVARGLLVADKPARATVIDADGLVALPEDLGVHRGEATRSLLAAKSVADFVQ